MPRPEKFVGWCLERADFDLSCSLQKIIADLHPESDYAWLIRWLPDAGEEERRKSGAHSAEELAGTSLGDVIFHMLNYHFIWITDTEIGWCGPYEAPLVTTPEEKPREAHRTWKCGELIQILQSEVASNPARLRKAIADADLKLDASR